MVTSSFTFDRSGLPALSSFARSASVVSIFFGSRARRMRFSVLR
jgi:hypothetical protein